MKYPSPICLQCIHLEKFPGEMRCEAFPGGIPEPIMESEIEHRQPYTGDHGIQFEEGTPAWSP